VHKIMIKCLIYDCSITHIVNNLWISMCTKYYSNIFSVYFMYKGMFIHGLYMVYASFIKRYVYKNPTGCITNT
jgi:hypothetical protein